MHHLEGTDLVMTVRQFTFMGDSLTNGDADAASPTEFGGKGSWVQLLTTYLASIPSIGPLIGYGLKLVAADLTKKWAQTGSWTATVSTDAFDKAPYGLGYYASGSSFVLKYTHPTQWQALVGFAVDWVDYAAGGAWSYRINGGAWTANGQTLQHDNHYCRFYVTAIINPGDTIEFRAADTGGTAAGCFIVGIHPFILAPSTADGLIIHNAGVGRETLHNLVASTSGDRLAFLDAVRLGTGSPIASTPNMGAIVEHVNDIHLINNTTTWATDLSTLQARVSPLCPFGIWTAWELDLTLDPAADQNAYRAQTKTSAAGFTPVSSVYDVFDAWNSKGFGGSGAQNAKILAAGLILILAGNAVHESQLGHVDLAERLFGWVRQIYLADYDGVPEFMTSSSIPRAGTYAASSAVSDVIRATGPIASIGTR